MKKLYKLLSIFLLLVVLCTIAPKQSKAQNAPVNFQAFYDGLSPYGQWINYQGYGYAWVPNAGADFVPYSTAGHWVWTDYGWTWASDYDWGWAPFHYGRWEDDSYYGWVWIPDTEWAPAWVSWRTSPGYYGWTPLEPGISFDMAISNYNPPAERWIFLPERYMGRNDIRNYYQPRQNNHIYFNNSRVINYTYEDRDRHAKYISGPRRDDVQRATGSEIKSYTIKNNNTPGQRFNNTELNLYRPRVERGSNDKPLKIAERNDVNRHGNFNDRNNRNNNGNRENNERLNPTDRVIDPAKPTLRTETEHSPQPVQIPQPVQPQANPKQQRIYNHQQPVRQIPPQQQSPAVPVQQPGQRVPRHETHIQQGTQGTQPVQQPRPQMQPRYQPQPRPQIQPQLRTQPVQPIRPQIQQPQPQPPVQQQRPPSQELRKEHVQSQ